MKTIKNTGLFAGTMATLLLAGCGGSEEAPEQTTQVSEVTAESFGGFWQPVAHISELKTIDGQTPPLLPDALALYQERKNSKTDGIPKWDNEHNCLPLGIPRLMANYPFELVVSDENLVVIYEWNNHVQLIPIADEFGELAYPFYLGTSKAAFNADGWTIDSEYFDETTILDERGMPHSDSLMISQELHLEGKDKLVNTMTIEDPNVFSQSWQTKITYNRMPAGSQLAEDVCVQRLGLKDLDTAN